MRIVTLSLVLSCTSALAYWAPDHVKLNHQVFCKGKPWGTSGFKRGSRTVTAQLDYARSVLYLARPGSCDADEDALRLRGVKFADAAVLPGLDDPTDAPNESHSLRGWNEKGGLWEDGFNDFTEAMKWGGRRAVNHFHDPLTGEGGYTGLTSKDEASGLPFVDLLRRGISATRWVMNGTSGGNAGKNLWGYPTIGQSLHRAFTEKPNQRRQSGLACAFRAMGQVEHLIEDNSVPDHARDLPHPGDGWEEYMTRRGSDWFTDYPYRWVPFPVTQVESGGLRSLWDRDVYGGAPEVTWLAGLDPPGLSEFVNANFLAWNRYKIIDYSTIPDGPGQPFKRGWHLSPGQGEIDLPLGLSLRTNSVTYPYPELGELASNHHFASGPHSMPLKSIANDAPSIDGVDWAWYRAPLISRALGYAQSVVSLALQPARAEVVPSPDGDPLSLTVRLWNLWAPGDPNAVTWHIEHIDLVGVRRDRDKPIPLGDEDPIRIFTPLLTIGPGQHAETPEAIITWPQRGVYRYMSHSAILVTGHLGDTNKTPILFAVPIANAAVWVRQTSGVDLTPPFVNTTQNCATSPCSYAGENGVYRNPEHQKLTGKIELAPSELDIFGRPADAELKAVQKEDARVAGVALFAMSHLNTLDLVRPNKSKLTLSGAPQLTATAIPGVFVRGADAPDVADAPFDFEIDLHVADFDVPTADPVADAIRASGSVYLAVWTTAGAVQLQRLAVWPWVRPSSAQSVITPVSCDVWSIDHGINESRGICTDSGSQQSGVCSNTTFHQTLVEIMYGDLGISHASGALAGIPAFVMAFAGSNDIRITSLAGHQISLGGDAMLPNRPCTTAQLLFFSSGNGEAVCPEFAAGAALFYSQNTTGNGVCGGSPQPPAKPRVGEYKRVFLPPTVKDLKDSFGIAAPEEWTFSLTAQ